MHRRLVAFVAGGAGARPGGQRPRRTASRCRSSIRPSASCRGGVPAAGYFNVRNDGDGPVVLTGARSPGCGLIMFHKSSMLGGMSRMQDVPSLTIAARQQARFQPGGLHLMCMNPTAMMATAKTVPVTLQFDGGHSATANFHLTDARGVER